jgi:hypothetical protein
LGWALGWAELHVLTYYDGVGLGLGQAQLLLLDFCIGGYGPLAFSGLAAGHVPLAGDFGCRWLAGLAAGQGGAGYRLLDVV